MVGTADCVDIWLLLEYKPSWRARAVTDNDLSGETQMWLQRLTEELAMKGLRARPQFIRQPELDVDEVRLFVATAEGLFCFQSTDYQAIESLDLVEALATKEFSASAFGFSHVEKPLYFVCTNGQRDLCCARYGLPVYKRLRDLVADRVWQTTHLGGHRFAPNVLALPQGVLYGRVNPDEVAQFIEQVDEGRLSRQHVRGRSVFPPEAQVAEVLLDEEVLELIECTEGRVVVRTEKGERSVGVELGPPLDIIASCGEESPKQARPFSGRLAHL